MTSFKFTALRSLGVITGLCLAMLTPSIASAVLIDNFSNMVTVARTAGTMMGQGNGITVGSLQGPLSGVIPGTGSRQGTVEIVSNSTNNPVRVSSLDIGFNELAFSNSSGIRGRMTLDYTNIGIVNATAPGQALVYNIVGNDVGGTFSLTLRDGTITNTATQALAPATLGQFQFSISAAVFPTVNRAAITSITFSYLTNGENGDLTLRNGLDLTTVPEPSSLAIALTGLGLAGVYFRRRRNQMIA